MFPEIEFYGSTTVGERGQIVLPAEVRKRFGIRAGDKLLVIGPKNTENGWVINLMESSVLSHVFRGMSENIDKIMEAHMASEKKKKGKKAKPKR